MHFHILSSFQFNVISLTGRLIYTDGKHVKDSIAFDEIGAKQMSAIKQGKGKDKEAPLLSHMGTPF